MGFLEKDWKKDKAFGKTPRKGLNPGQDILLLWAPAWGHWGKGSKPSFSEAQGKMHCCLEEGKRKGCPWGRDRKLSLVRAEWVSYCWRRAGDAILQEARLRCRVEFGNNGQEDSINSPMAKTQWQRTCLRLRLNQDNREPSSPLPPNKKQPLSTKGSGTRVWSEAGGLARVAEVERIWCDLILIPS